MGADAFTLKIQLGNDAMQSNEHVAEALRDVAERVLDGSWEGFVRDVNGNTVGRFKVKLS